MEKKVHYERLLGVARTAVSYGHNTCVVRTEDLILLLSDVIPPVPDEVKKEEIVDYQDH